MKSVLGRWWYLLKFAELPNKVGSEGCQWDRSRPTGSPRRDRVRQWGLLKAVSNENERMNGGYIITRLHRQLLNKLRVK